MLLRRYISLGFVLSLSACGFHPLYAPNGREVTSELAEIKIAMIPDRLGQILRNKLLDTMTPYGEPKNHHYLLKVTLMESRSDLAFRKDATPKRAQIISTAAFALIDQESKRVIYNDTVDATTAFSIGSQADFASFPAIVSEQKARERAMEILAQDIKLQIAAFLSTKKE